MSGWAPPPKSRRTVDYDRLQQIGRDLLEAIGEDPNRSGISDTPRRFADMWREFIEYDPGRIETSFAVDTTNQLVAVTGIQAWSICEHHLLPFWMNVAVAYISGARVLGMSKFARAVAECSHKPQIQERFAWELANAIQYLTGSADVAVATYGEHLCTQMRGVRSDMQLHVHELRGAFFHDDRTRAEFMSILIRRTGRVPA